MLSINILVFIGVIQLNAWIISAHVVASSDHSRASYTNQEALQICQDAFSKDHTLIAVTAANLFDLTSFLNDCAQDILTTGKPDSVQMHVDLTVTYVLNNLWSFTTSATTTSTATATTVTPTATATTVTPTATATTVTPTATTTTKVTTTSNSITTTTTKTTTTSSSSSGSTPDGGHNCKIAVSVEDEHPILVNEKDKFGRIKIVLPDHEHCPLNHDLKVHFHFEPHTATFDDFSNMHDFVTFASGERTKEVEFLIHDNNLVEPTRFFTFVIDSVTGTSNHEIRTKHKVIFIEDDDYNKNGAVIGEVFDLMNRSHAEETVNLYFMNDYFTDSYELCPGEGGLTSQYKTMEMFVELLDSYYKIYTLEIHNPSTCNVNEMRLYFADSAGNQIISVPADSLHLNNFTFIDVNYLATYHHSQLNVSKVDGLLLTFRKTKDGKNPTKCELRIFGKKVSGRK